MKNVIYKVYLNIRNNRGEFKRDIVETLDDLQNPHIQIWKWRTVNLEPDCRYVLGHVK